MSVAKGRPSIATPSRQGRPDTLMRPACQPGSATSRGQNGDKDDARPRLGGAATLR
ncbi:hypothetical protein [Actinacidiphila bryophytorum]|uniref:Uncharacterized protein n=1 Tax=Actinacidiphila bryophytorum TaxID=1436133 RepID=A0A9W4H7M0_9ACTN|nr:hypothetical protein [Actinacidiphila bryophytorum]MBM9438302.1 hypothetical protein [Actinacidiphila bryophytorum]MBN6545753.1 hypothetical protein [Actinacidiphila bryophytorum]CAG7657947.1 hypothetical protein SBRY_90094 [Actinacidiphila bryophytorum]